MGQVSYWIMIVCNGLLWSHKWSGTFIKRRICSCKNIKSQTVHTHSSDPPQHTCNPPVAWHDNLTDDTSSLVVVGPWVEATQGLVVAAAVAVTTATVLAAVTVVIQAVIQLDSSISLQREQEWPGLTSYTWQMPVLPRQGHEEKEEGIGWIDDPALVVGQQNILYVKTKQQSTDQNWCLWKCKVVLCLITVTKRSR